MHWLKRPRGWRNADMHMGLHLAEEDCSELLLHALQRRIRLFLFDLSICWWIPLSSSWCPPRCLQRCSQQARGPGGCVEPPLNHQFEPLGCHLGELAWGFASCRKTSPGQICYQTIWRTVLEHPQQHAIGDRWFLRHHGRARSSPRLADLSALSLFRFCWSCLFYCWQWLCRSSCLCQPLESCFWWRLYYELRCPWSSWSMSHFVHVACAYQLAWPMEGGQHRYQHQASYSRCTPSCAGHLSHSTSRTWPLIAQVLLLPFDLGFTKAFDFLL